MDYEQDLLFATLEKSDTHNMPSPTHLLSMSGSVLLMQTEGLLDFFKYFTIENAQQDSFDRCFV